MKSRLAIFASGSGSNAEAIMKYFQNHSTIEVVALASNRADAFALERAKKFRMPTKVFDKNQFKESESVIKWLDEHKITHVVLAGFLLLIPTKLIEAFPNRIINIHPSLLPKFGGKGMYGLTVHQEVIKAGVKWSGPTVHIMDEIPDHGQILAHVQVPVVEKEIDEAPALAERILPIEHKLFWRVIAQQFGRGTHPNA